MESWLCVVTRRFLLYCDSPIHECSFLRFCPQGSIVQDQLTDRITGIADCIDIAFGD